MPSSQPSTLDIVRFCLKYSRLGSVDLLTNCDPARVIALHQLDEYLSKSDPHPKRIAVVSGSSDELELALFPARTNVELLNFEDNPFMFDLTRDWSSSEWNEYQGKFDLVLCEQVLEHVIDPRQAIENLATIAKPGGLIHISAPAINNRHGPPHYYFAGFPPETLRSYSEGAGLHVEEASYWASDKGSRMYATCDWAPLAVCGGFRFLALAVHQNFRRPRVVWKILRGRMRNFLTYPLQRLIGSETQNGVITWIIARKPG